jgi:hypothetical protein
MKTMTIRTTIGPDGAIDLHIPSNLPPGPATVQVTIQPIPTQSYSSQEEASADSELAESADVQLCETDLEAPSKTCSGLFLGRLPEDYDIDAAIEEMNARWKAKLEDLRLEP